jgi:hypothetical protein
MVSGGCSLNYFCSTSLYSPGPAISAGKGERYLTQSLSMGDTAR